MLSDEWLQRYRLLENFTAKWNGNGNGNAYDRGDYNSSFALFAVKLKMAIFWTILGKAKASIKRPLEKMEKKRTYLTLLASEFVALSPNEQVFFSLEVQINDKYTEFV